MTHLSTILGDPATAAVVQIVVLAVLAWTLHVLIGYAKDTKTIAEATVFQARAQHRPLLVLETESRRYDIAAGWEQAHSGQVLRGEIDGDLRLSNIGPGPAFELWIETEGSPAFRFYEPHLDSGRSLPVGISSLWFSQKEDGTETEVRIRYRGVGGRFESRYALVARRRSPRPDDVSQIERSYLAVSSFSAIDQGEKATGGAG